MTDRSEDRTGADRSRQSRSRQDRSRATAPGAESGREPLLPAEHDCAALDAALPLFVGGDLEPAELDAVERELERCPACRARRDGLATARHGYVEAGFRAGSEPVSLWPGVRARLVAEGRLATAPTERGPSPSPAPVLADRARPARGDRRRFLALGTPLLAAAAGLLILLAIDPGVAPTDRERPTDVTPVADGGADPTAPTPPGADGLRHVEFGGRMLEQPQGPVLPGPVELPTDPAASARERLVGGGHWR